MLLIDEGDCGAAEHHRRPPPGAGVSDSQLASLPAAGRRRRHCHGRRRRGCIQRLPQQHRPLWQRQVSLDPHSSGRGSLLTSSTVYRIMCPTGHNQKMKEEADGRTTASRRGSPPPPARISPFRGNLVFTTAPLLRVPTPSEAAAAVIVRMKKRRNSPQQSAETIMNAPRTQQLLLLLPMEVLVAGHHHHSITTIPRVRPRILLRMMKPPTAMLI